MLIRILVAFLISTGASQSFSALDCRELFQFSQLASMPSSYGSFPKLPVGMKLEDFAENSVARMYVEFAVRNMLLNQNAEILDQRGLLVLNGGLCGFACVSNITGAIAARRSNFLSFATHAPRVVEGLLELYRLNTGHDGRMGARLDILTETLGSRFPEILKEFGYASLLESLHVSSSQMTSHFSARRILREIQGDTIIFAAIKPVGQSSQSEAKGHAIVVLGIDIERKKLVLSDPNNPNQILSVPYYSSFDSDIQFRAPFTYDGRLVEFYHMTFLERHIYKIR